MEETIVSVGLATALVGRGIDDLSSAPLPLDDKDAEDVGVALASIRSQARPRL